MNAAIKPMFVHNGTTITLEDNGRFSAMSPTGRITSGSLDGIKKRLDKDGVFEQFKGFTLRSLYRGDELEEVTVIGFAEPRRRFGQREWKIIDARGNKSQRSEVYEDTPTNRALAKQYLEMRKAHLKQREESDAAESKLRGKLKTRRPGDKA